MFPIMLTANQRNQYFVPLLRMKESKVFFVFFSQKNITSVHLIKIEINSVVYLLATATFVINSRYLLLQEKQHNVKLQFFHACKAVIYAACNMNCWYESITATCGFCSQKICL